MPFGIAAAAGASALGAGAIGTAAAGALGGVLGNFAVGEIGNAISPGQNPSVTQEPPQQDTSSGQQSSLAQLLSLLGGGSAGTAGTNTSPAYTQPLTAQLTGAQNTTLSDVGNSISQLLSPTGALAQGQASAESVANATPASFNSYFQNSVVQPAMQDFNTQTIPALQRAFGASAGGTQSSDYVQAVDTATNNLENSITAAGSAAALTQYNSDQTNKISAANALNSSANTALAGESLGLSAQALPQTTQQTTYSNAYQEFINQLGQNNLVNNQLLSASTAATQTAGNTIANTGTQGLGTTLLQGLSSAQSAGGSSLSTLLSGLINNTTGVSTGNAYGVGASIGGL